MQNCPGTETPMTGEGPNLGEDRISQDYITYARPLKAIQKEGLRIFTTPFNRFDGYGDGPFDPAEVDPREFGNRPSLQGNGTFLRVNGLDGQTCLECHLITRNSTIPATLGIGGIAGGASHPIVQPSFINVADGTGAQVPGTNPGDINGRFINPPFLFGSGGIELAGKEMTIRLQELKAEAISHPDMVITLDALGVNFGTIVYSGGSLDTSHVKGIDEDLVVKPFGRKGEFATIRSFDLGAMQFHFGMQPVEVVGEDVDADHDGVVNELLDGEISVLHIFLTTRSKPVMDKQTPETLQGFNIFTQIGCVYCHKPFFITKSRKLTYSFPEVETDPTANIFYRVDLARTANFAPSGCGGIIVPSFSDLKRHNMGPSLAESFDLVSEKRNREFITARLWGVRDTAPYLHDGRATTVMDAILKHGGEAQAVRDNFDSLNQNMKKKVIAFLYSLRTPLDDAQVSFDDAFFSKIMSEECE
ncbi:MAG: di-heme oxidoredictase family protein [bacterium]